MPNIGGVGRRDGDVGEFVGVGVRVHRAVAVDQHPIAQQHEETTRHDRGAGARLHELEGRSDRVGRRVGRTRHHAVGESLLHHHRAEVTDVGHDVAGLVERDALVAAQLVVALGEPVEQVRLERVDHRHVEVEAELVDARPHLVDRAREG
jgi:hypothetical protein